MARNDKTKGRISHYCCLFCSFLWVIGAAAAFADRSTLQQEFMTPPDVARPGVYWYFMDGNMNRDAMTADLESMKAAGIGNILFLEVNIGVPRGPVDFMSNLWQDNFVHMVRQSQRLGIEVIVGTGPGWTGSGGPWVKPEESMQHLCAGAVQAHGPSALTEKLPVPAPWNLSPWSGLGGNLAQIRNAWYEDVAVLAFPTPKGDRRIDDLEGKVFFLRGPYSSMAGIKPFLSMPASYPALPTEEVIDPAKVIDLTNRLRPDGSLDWEVPAGDWTIMRFASRSTGQTTRPAPAPGYGFETDKFRKKPTENHHNAFTAHLLNKTGSGKDNAGWTRLHLDSWEVGAQNWTQGFRQEFQRRRSYDPQPYFPAYQGMIVGSLEKTERFLWDLRKTAQELTLENHAEYYKELSHQAGLQFSIEPYDMNFAGDLDLGAVADIPQCEFWTAGDGFDTVYSCIEATSIAHTMGRPLVAAEAFTTGGDAGIKHYPGMMKNQTDWAFAIGINRIIFHTFQHQPLGPEYKPGMAMGVHGVHWHRNQTFWPMVSEYHRYISRCSHLLSQGIVVADILYLTPEGAPHVFVPPASAIEGTGPLRDQKGYRFDGVSPNILMSRAKVVDGKIAFPAGTSYQMLVLPDCPTMTPKLLTKIKELVQAGATVVGAPPMQSPSLSDYPACDSRVKALAAELWGGLKVPASMTERPFGQGRIFWGQAVAKSSSNPAEQGTDLYPDYAITADLLKQKGIPQDFSASGPVRFIHRQTEELDIYFVSNRSDKAIDVEGSFRVQSGRPELWHPVTGQSRPLQNFTIHEKTVSIPLRFEAYESYFVIFPRGSKPDSKPDTAKPNFPSQSLVAAIDGPWEVSFDPAWGGPEKIIFDTLQDWTSHANEGIKYYSGIATYRNTFDVGVSAEWADTLYLNLGTVHNIARVRLNGSDLGVVWTSPWQVKLGDRLKRKGNILEIEVTNTWVNRLIGDEQPANKDVRQVKWDNGLLEGKSYPAGRYTFTTYRYYKADMPLAPSGLLGPVTIQSINTPTH